MSSGVRSGAGKQNPSRVPRLDAFGHSSSFDPPQSSFRNNSFGQGKQSWDSSSNIWGVGGLPRNSSYDGQTDTEPLRGQSSSGSNGIVTEGRTGSSSLLSSSESEGWSGRQPSQWPPLATVPSGKSNLSGTHVSPTKSGFLNNATPLHPEIGRGSSPRFPPPGSRSSDTFGNSSATANALGPHRRSDTAYPSLKHDTNDNELRQSHNSSSFATNLMTLSFRQDLPSLRSESDLATSNGLGLSTIESYPSRTSSSAVNQPKTRPSGPVPFSHLSASSLSALSPPPTHSPHPSIKSLSNDLGSSADYEECLRDGLNDLQMHDKNPKAQPNGFTFQRHGLGSQTSFEAFHNGNPLQSGGHRTFSENGDTSFPSFAGDYQAHPQPGKNPLHTLTNSRSQMGNTDFNTNFGNSRGSSMTADFGGSPSTGYSTRSASSEASTIGRKTGRSIAPMQLESRPFSINSSNSHLQYPYSYDMASQMQLGLSPGFKYFSQAPHMYGGFQGLPVISKYSNADHDSNQRDRSPLLKDFRATFKTRDWELKDIYGHFVEFCGDQHASRMIQQKLETANGDDKEQIFREILPESFPVMTDIFGNYVIQKLFEHGDQWQKKNLANHMKGHVHKLTKQMYGCRVVQKALEHVLAEQQASLIHELDKDVIDCVKDQNGNHVIQKAIEMVPSKHLEAIIHSVLRDVRGLAMDKFGCRVVQRMLEHCEDHVKERMTRDLRPHIRVMVVHQFGNYVIQNILTNGPSEDRRLVTDEVLSNLLFYCKNKFASNVVEKALDYSPEIQRTEIVRRLTTSNDKGESPVISLVHDSFGNYVIQKVLRDLPLEERDRICNEMRPHLARMKKLGYGAKPIAAIERVIYEGDRAHERQQDRDREPSQSSTSTSQSSSLLPSTNASTVEGPIHKDELSSASDITIAIKPEMQTTHSPKALEKDAQNIVR